MESRIHVKSECFLFLISNSVDCVVIKFRNQMFTWNIKNGKSVRDCQLLCNIWNLWSLSDLSVLHVLSQHVFKICIRNCKSCFALFWSRDTFENFRILSQSTMRTFPNRPRIYTWFIERMKNLLKTIHMKLKLLTWWTRN